MWPGTFPSSSRTRRRLHLWKKHRACVQSADSLSYLSIYTYIHAYTHTYKQTYNFVPQNCFYFSILHHLLCLSFLPRPASTFVAHYWKKLTCLCSQLLCCYTIAFSWFDRCRSSKLLSRSCVDSGMTVFWFNVEIDLHFVWPAWHLWHWAGFGGALVHAHLVHTQLVTTCPHTHNSHTHTPCHHTTYSHTPCRHTTCPHTSYSHTHIPSTYICCTRRSFTISFLFPAFPIPSLPFFCCLLEEVDMWGYPVLELLLLWWWLCLFPYALPLAQPGRRIPCHQ